MRCAFVARQRRMVLHKGWSRWNCRDRREVRTGLACLPKPRNMEAFTKSEDILRGRLDGRLWPSWAISWNTNRQLRALERLALTDKLWLVPLTHDGHLLGRRSGSCDYRHTLAYAVRVPSPTMPAGHELLRHQGCFALMLRDPEGNVQ
jgi:hypothetical protein